MATSNGTRSLLARNSMYGLLSWLLPVVPSIFVTPVVIRRLGADNYGLYVAVLGLTSYFFTLGLGRIATKYVAQFNAADDEDRVSEYVSATFVVTLVPTIICLIGVLISSAWVIREVLRIGPSSAETAQRGISLAALIILTTAASQVWLGALQGLHRFDKYFWLSNAASLLLSVGVLFVALLGGGVISLLSWTVVLSGINLVVCWALISRMVPKLRLFTIGRQCWKDVWTYGLGIMGYQVFGLVLLLFERGLIIRNFGLDALSFYVVPMNLALLVPTVVGSLILAVFPVLNEKLGDRGAITRLYERVSKIVLLVSGFAIATSAAAGPSFLRLWLGEDFAKRSATLLVIHVATFSIIASTLIIWQVAESFRVAPVTAAANAAVAIISIPLMILFGNSWELQGVALARLVGLIPYIALLLYVERKFLDGGSARRWIPRVAICFLPALAAFGSEYGILIYAPVTWLTFGLAMVLGAGCFLITCILIGEIDTADATIFRSVIARQQPDA